MSDKKIIGYYVRNKDGLYWSHRVRCYSSRVDATLFSFRPSGIEDARIVRVFLRTPGMSAIGPKATSELRKIRIRLRVAEAALRRTQEAIEILLKESGE